jgi:FkbM family methyltransferase
MFIISKHSKSINKKFNIKVKLTIAKVFNNLSFLDSVLKQSRGVGYTASLDTEVKYLVGLHNENFTLFDIGANIGNYSLMVKKLFPKSIIYSFEPSKTTFDQLVQNTKSELSITPYQIGFGEERKQTNLYSDKAGSEMASTYHRQFGNAEIEFNRIETINIDTLDNWVHQNKVTPDFVKIDVEGAELSVLRGSINVLKNVKAVQFEFGGTAIDAKNHFRDYWNFFTELNFKLYRYTPSGLLRIESYSEREEIFEFMNYLAVPIRNNHLQIFRESKFFKPQTENF